MPSVEQVSTLGCISNKVGGDLISNAIWKGIRLKDLLDQTQIKEGAEYVVFRCFDGYDLGIPLTKALEEGTILAYEMNRETLTPAHGYPVRAIVPDIYGMMNAKWITEIEIVDYVYEGFWQRKGWSNTARINTLSSIVIPGGASIRTRFRGFLPETDTGHCPQQWHDFISLHKSSKDCRCRRHSVRRDKGNFQCASKLR